MRMPFMEFATGGDPKFMIAITILFVVIVVQLLRQRKLNSDGTDLVLIERLSNQMNLLSFTILMMSPISLLLGFQHSFYFIGQMDGINPKLLYGGVSRTLISPTYGLIMYTISKLLIAVLGKK